MTREKGILVISLDFELYWGLRDKIALENYRDNLLGVSSVIPSMLKIFKKYEIHATWATVGFLFFNDRKELITGLPEKRPGYFNDKLSPYKHIFTIGNDEAEDPVHFAPSLIKMITDYPHQEIGTHTFSHYYCLEKGQNREAFKYDLWAAKQVARKYNLCLESIVFPRNQVNSKYMPLCKRMGIKAYQGNPSSWLYEPITENNQSLLKRGLRLLDAYINLSGHNCYSCQKPDRHWPVNIPASRFLRPYSKKLRVLEPLRLHRIRSDLTYAAKHGLMYHLCWHPHNFGVNQEENLSFLEQVMEHFKELQAQHGMVSLNMKELAREITV